MKYSTQTFIDKVYALAHAHRYSMLPRAHNESVAEHSYFVALITVLLYNDYEFNLEKALLIALAHDVPEMEISDVNHVVKQQHPELAAQIRNCERRAAARLPNLIQQAFTWHDEDDSVESTVVQLADALQVLQYARAELSMGNQAFNGVVEETTIRIIKLKRELLQHARGNVS